MLTKLRNALRKLSGRSDGGETRNLDAAASMHGGGGSMPPNYVKSYDDGRPKH